MQVSCPGCGQQVSDRAPRCPFCGRVAGPASTASGEASVVHHLGAADHRALLLRRQKRYPEAVATLDLALALAPANAFVRSATAECLEAAGRPFGAARAWPRWKALSCRRARERLHELRGGAR